MRTLLIALCFATAVQAQAPSSDIRNTLTPGTGTHFAAPRFPSLAAWEARKGHLKKQILSAAGLFPMPVKTPLHPQVFGRIARNGYSVEKVLLETLRDYYLGGNLYRPTGRAGRFPGVLSPHGHWDYGRLENSAIASVPGRCINLARQGYVVFSYDMVGYDDTIQTPHDFGGRPEALWSFHPLGLQLWNSIRALDFLQSLANVDPDRIAATGASGGATQILMLAAIDERVKVAAPVNMISFIMQGGSQCENAPGLRMGTSNVEIGAMMAPRPLLMVAATGDWTRNTPREELPAVRAIYELYGKPENVETVQFHAEHNYNQDSREAVYHFFAKRLLADADSSKYREHEFHPEKPSDLLALHNRTLPGNALTLEGLFEEWRAMSTRQTQAEDADTLRAGLTYALGAEWPDRVFAESQGQRIVLSRAGHGDRVPAIWLDGEGAPALVVDENGAETARRSAKVRELIRAHRPVLLIDAFQTGSAVAPRDRTGQFFLTFNLSDDANRVQDILTALRHLGIGHAGATTLIGSGKAAVWTLFAAAIAPVRVHLEVDLGGFAGSDRDFLDQFFVPGIQRAGGLQAALRLTDGER